MARMFVVCGMLLALPVIALSENAPARTVIALDVQAMPELKPALKYPLLPELKDTNPGNVVQEYLKCFMEQNHFFHSKTSVENRDKWLTMPLKDLPLKELRNYGGSALRQADHAARLDTVDWQILLRLKREGVNLLLPEVQHLRMLALALKVRFRAEVAERRFEDAIRTAQTMFALARHLGEHPTLIGDLLGMAVTFTAIGPLEEMLQQPGCPNLYWSLTDLPSPFIDLRQGLQGERVFFSTELGLIKSRPMSQAQIEEVLDLLDRLFKGMTLTEGLASDNVKTSPPSPPSPPPPPPGNKTAREWLEDQAKDKAHVNAARKRLVESGLSAAVVKKLSAIQVVLLDEKREYEVQRDEVMKWRGVPYWRAEAGRQEMQLKERNRWLFAQFLPSILKVFQAQARVDQRIALLRHVEAIRIYAAEHDGKLPARLTDIKVPLPVDPFTGKAFVYEVVGRKAILRGSPPRGLEKHAIYNVHYEVTIRK